jgi:hypothetical protein
MIRAAKIYLTLFMLAIFLPGISVANEKYPLLAESGAEAKPVETMQVAENIFIPGEEIIVAGDEQAELTGAEPAVIVDSDPPVTTESGPEVTAEPGEQDEIEPPAIIKPAALIAVIIDDLGNQRTAGERTVALEGPVACAIMPHTRHATYLAERAFAAGKEVMLHLPMQPMQMQRIAGPGEISLDTKRRQLDHILQTDLNSVPHAVGVNNHMGSLITRHPGHMRWLMEELSRRGDLFFVDSYTTPSSVAIQNGSRKRCSGRKAACLSRQRSNVRACCKAVSAP